jgi:PAS domain S-box-containing protein
MLTDTCYRSLFDEAPIGLALCDMKGNLKHVNQAYADLLGRTIEETLKKSYWEITPKIYKNAERTQLELIAKESKFGPYEKEYIHKNGTFVPVRLSGRVINLKNKKYIYTAVERIGGPYLSAMFEMDKLGIALCTLDGHLVAVNQKYANILGRSVEETLKLSYWEITPVDYKNREELMKRIIAVDERFGPYEKHYKRSDGVLTKVRLHGWKVTIDGRDFIWTIVQDLGELQPGDTTRLLPPPKTGRRRNDALSVPIKVAKTQKEGNEQSAQSSE